MNAWAIKRDGKYFAGCVDDKYPLWSKGLWESRIWKSQKLAEDFALIRDLDYDQIVEIGEVEG